jgi:hypothetical protein
MCLTSPWQVQYHHVIHWIGSREHLRLNASKIVKDAPNFARIASCVSFDFFATLSASLWLCQSHREVLQGRQVFTTPWFRQPKTSYRARKEWTKPCIVSHGHTPSDMARPCQSLPSSNYNGFSNQPCRALQKCGRSNPFTLVSPRSKPSRTHQALLLPFTRMLRLTS